LGPNFDSIFFDFDGVLADTEPIHFECWREILCLYGIHVDWPTYDRLCRGVPDMKAIQRLCAHRNRQLDFDVIWAEYPRKEEAFRTKVRNQEVVVTAVRQLLAELEFYRLAVVSSSARIEVEPPLIRAGVRDRFAAVVCCEDVPHLKPAPDPYLKAAALTGARRPLVVEDSDPGHASGEAAGFEVLRVREFAQMPDLLRERLALRMPKERG
jgi:beta-phosphoglucomutase